MAPQGQALTIRAGSAALTPEPRWVGADAAARGGAGAAAGIPAGRALPARGRPRGAGPGRGTERAGLGLGCGPSAVPRDARGHPSPRRGRARPSLPGIVLARSRRAFSGSGPEARRPGALCRRQGAAGGPAPERPLREGPPFRLGRNGETEAAVGKRLVPGHAAKRSERNRAGRRGVPGPSPRGFQRQPRPGRGVGSGRGAHPPGRPGAGPRQPRPGPTGCGARGRPRLPDVGAAARELRGARSRGAGQSAPRAGAAPGRAGRGARARACTARGRTASWASAAGNW